MAFWLKSTATAIAIVPPAHLYNSINDIRSVHDKSVYRWPPHINLLYPFVDPSRLSEAVQLLRQLLSASENSDITVRLTDTDVFRNRKKATIFLKPGQEAEGALYLLRVRLAAALGCGAREGAYHSEFKPHLTIGQAALNDAAIAKPKDKANDLIPLEWVCRSFVVFKREKSGKMTVLEEISLGGRTLAPKPSLKVPAQGQGWRTSHSFTPECGWARSSWHKQPAVSHSTVEPVSEVTISSYNVMTAEYAPALNVRFPLLVDAISSIRSSDSVSVLCLQEVSKDLLSLLLSNPSIQNSYPYSTHHPSTDLHSIRNLVTLASAPFTHYTLRFTEHHKLALIADFGGLNFRVANVHLTSALTDRAVLAKKSQMSTLTKFLVEDSRGEDIFVAGDFNLTTSAQTVETALSQRLVSFKTARSLRSVIDRNHWVDAFEVFHEAIVHERFKESEGEQGATFDRMSNPLAAMSEGLIDNRPQRYDRVLFRKSGEVHVDKFEIFGYPAGDGTCASDHYGVTTTLGLSGHQRDTTMKQGQKIAATEDSDIYVDYIDLVEDDTDVQSLIGPYSPTESDRQCREDALALLRTTLRGSDGSSDMIFAPLGSYAMNTYLSKSDVDVLIIGSIPSEEFFRVALARLQTLAIGDTPAITSIHLVQALVPIIELTVFGIDFDLQYCEAKELVQSRNNESTPQPLESLISSTAMLLAFKRESLLAINAFRDMSHLQHTIPDLDAYRIAHRYLALFLKRRGLYSARFGYLGGIQLSLMLNRVVKLMSRSSSRSSLSSSTAIPSDTSNNISGAVQVSTSGLTPASIIRTFLSHYSDAESYLAPILDPDHPHDYSFHDRNSRPEKGPPALILPPLFTPAARSNTAYASSPLSVAALRAEFTLAASKLAETGVSKGWNWCLRPRNDSIREFFSSWEGFIRIRLDVWDNSVSPRNRSGTGDELGFAERTRNVIGILESRSASLMLALGRVDGVNARIWPGRFCDFDALGDDQEHAGCVSLESGEGTGPASWGAWYFIGISASTPIDATAKKETETQVLAAAKAFEGTLRVLDDFATTGNVGAWIDVDISPRKAVEKMGLQLDERNLDVVFPSLPGNSLNRELVAGEIRTRSNTSAQTKRHAHIAPNRAERAD